MKTKEIPRKIGHTGGTDSVNVCEYQHQYQVPKYYQQKLRQEKRKRKKQANIEKYREKNKTKEILRQIRHTGGTDSLNTCGYQHPYTLCCPQNSVIFRNYHTNFRAGHLAFYTLGFCLNVFNKPGVAGAVLQSSPSLIHYFINSLTDPLVKVSSKHTQSQTGRARELKF